MEPKIKKKTGPKLRPPRVDLPQDRAHPSSKYRKEFDQMLVDHLSRGGRFEDFSVIAKVSARKLYEWVNRWVSFRQAKELGEAGSYKFWLDIGRAGMTGQLETKTKHYEIDEVTGKKKLVKEIEHPASFNASAWTFMMKNRYGWRDQRVIEHQGKDGGAIEIETRKSLDGLSTEELEQLERILTKIAPPEKDDKDGPVERPEEL